MRAALLYLGVSLVVTWPLAMHLGTHLPIGSLDAPTVPWFNLWTLEWNADRLSHGYAGYWDAPIFFPVRDAFALSEPQALTGAAFALLRPVFGAVGAYDVLVLLSLTLNGVAARRMLRVSGTSETAAVVGGVFAVAAAFAVKELGVLQLLALYAPLFALAELCLLMRGTATRGVWLRLGLAFGATVWTCVYYALFLAVLGLLGLILAVVADRGLVRSWRAALLGAALALGLTAPLAVVQHRALAAKHRSDETVHDGSATLRAYTRLPLNALSEPVSPLRAGVLGSRSLYPGTALLALALVDLLRKARGERDAWGDFCLLGLGVAFVLSFGTRIDLFGFRPYESVVQRFIPGFSQLRTPYRFAAFAGLFLVASAGPGIDVVLEEIRAVRRGGERLRRYLPAAAVAVLATSPLECVAKAQELRRFPSEDLEAPWVSFLREHPGGAVAMVPPERSGKAADFEPVTLAMLQSLVHGHPLAGGYSGFFPARARALGGTLRHFPNRASLEALHAVPVRYVVVDEAWLASRGERAEPASVPPEFARVHASAGRAVYELR